MSKVPDLDLSLLTGNIAWTRLLIESGEGDINLVRPDTGATPISTACRFGNYEVVKLLLDAGADPTNIIHLDGKSALHLAFEHASEETFNMVYNKIFEKEADYNTLYQFLSKLDPSLLAIIKRRNGDRFVLKIISRWNKYFSKKVHMHPGTLSMIVDELIEHEKCENLQQYLARANIVNDADMIDIWLRKLYRKKNKELIQGGYTDAMRNGSSGNIISLYASYLYKLDKEFIKFYSLYSSGGLYSYRTHKVMDLLKAIGEITNFGVTLHFHCFVRIFHYSRVFTEMYQGVPCFYITMKHPHLWKYFYKCCLMDHYMHERDWVGLLEKAYAFSEWYQTTPRSDRAYLPALGSKDCMKVERKLSIVMEKPFICGNYTEYMISETQQITETIETCLAVLSEKIRASSNEKYAFTHILSGSTAEKTKTGYPDEYDFILHLDQLQGEFDERHKEFPFNATIVETSINISHICQNLILLYYTYTTIILSTLNAELKQYTFPLGFSLQKTIATGKDAGPLTMVINFKGHQYKDLAISVDLAPAFKISFDWVKKNAPELKPELEDAAAQQPMFVVIKSFGYVSETTRLSFSLLELEILESAPWYVQNGYRLAKAIRHSEICPPYQLSTNKFVPVFDYIPSYMLKTCVLHLIKETHSKVVTSEYERKLLNPDSIDFAYKIYEMMAIKLKMSNGKMPNYFFPMSDICSKYQVVNVCGEEEDHYNETRLNTLMAFVDHILELLMKLKQEQLTTKCEIQ